MCNKLINPLLSKKDPINQMELLSEDLKKDNFQVRVDLQDAMKFKMQKIEKYQQSKLCVNKH